MTAEVISAAKVDAEAEVEAEVSIPDEYQDLYQNGLFEDFHNDPTNPKHAFDLEGPEAYE